MVPANTVSRRTLLLGGLVWWMTGCAAGRADGMDYRVAVDGDGNRVNLSLDAGVVWVDVVSERGIGAAFVFVPAPVSLNLKFRLHLNSLEHFRLWWGGRTVTASVPVVDARAVQVWSRTDGQPDTPITPEAPDWLEIVPAADGASFEVTPPQSWQAAQPAFFGIGWIDAYR